MTWKKILQYILLAVVSLIVVGSVGFYIWAEQTYDPTEELESLVGDIPEEDDWIIYEPTESKNTGIILYPGAKVEPEAYSYLAKSLSEQGYYVGIPDLNLNLAIMDASKADEMIEKYPEVEHWYIGGHSMGGVSAGTYAYKNQDIIDGVIFLASYPMNSNDFSDVDMPMLSIYSELDGLVTHEDIEDSKEIVSNDTTFHEIKGGNHGQFGMYGQQKGDNEAEIAPLEQQDEIVDTIVNWLP